MSVLASLHDVSPAHARELEAARALCARHGLCPALLLVPDWHGRAPLERDLAFVRWLHARVEDKAEVFLHGDRHDEEGARPSFADRARAFGRTAGEGEFLSLSEDEARLKIELGLARLRALGFDPLGFVPPAWLAREACWRAAREAGLSVGEDERAVFDLRSGARVPAPVWRWSTRTAARARISRGVAALRTRLQAGAPWVRVALHPSDFRDPATIASLERTLAALCARHAPASYADLIASSSAPAAADGGAADARSSRA